jgi:singapore isolate B (sub-type 7) whole genome shotgun sequence assembly, scaffold_5
MKIADLVKNFVVIYLVDITEVPDFNAMYELFDPCTTMFFFRNKHMMIDLGTGNNNKINWPLTDKDEMIAIMETIYRGAIKGRGIVVSPFDYSTRNKFCCVCYRMMWTSGRLNRSVECIDEKNN